VPRRNLCTNPALDASNSGWGGDGTTPTRTSVSGFPKGFAARYTDGTFIRSPQGLASPTRTYTLSAYVSTALTGTRNGTIYFEWLNSGGGTISFSSTAISFVGASVARISHTATAPAGTASARMIIDGWTFSGNATDVSSVLLEETSSLASYADGDTAGWQWENDTQLSASSEITDPKSTRFDASSDRATRYASGPPLLSTGATFCFWCRIAVDRNDFSTFLRIHAGAVPGTTTVLNVATGAGGDVPSIFTVGGSVVGPTTFVLGKWYYVQVTVAIPIDVTVGTIFVTDPDTGTTQSASGTIDTSLTPTGLTIGGRSAEDASEWSNCNLGRLRLWSSVLTQTERDTERQALDAVRTSNLWADYRLDGANQLNDTSGNARHLTTGATATSDASGPPISSRNMGGFLVIM
jgi:hypothetical protein